MPFIIFIVFCGLVMLSYWVEPLAIFLCFGVFWWVFRDDTQKNWVKNILIFFLLFAWNAIPVYWLIYLHFWKGLLAYSVNTCIFFGLVWASLFIQKRTNKGIGAFSFMIFWLSMEYVHHFWDFGWAWLTLGNVFASRPEYVQWYSITGVLGGSVWVLVVSYFGYYFFEKKQYTSLIFCFLLIFLPFIFPKNKINVKEYSEVIFMQLNKQNFEKKEDNEKINKVLSELEKIITPNTRFIIFPEIFFTKIWLSAFDIHLGYVKLKKLTEKHPKISFIVGSILHKISSDTTKGILDTKTGVYYKSYNTALFINQNQKTLIKGKKYLIPITEFVPDYLGFLFGKSPYQKENITSNTFTFENQSASSFICYEATNSLLTATQQATQQSNFIAMIASEGFFKNDFGRKQYLDICRLRCIESNKYMVKSTYDGFASVINEKGEILKKSFPIDFDIKTHYIALQTEKTIYISYYFLWFWGLILANIVLFFFVILSIQKKS